MTGAPKDKALAGGEGFGTSTRHLGECRPNPSTPEPLRAYLPPLSAQSRQSSTAPGLAQEPPSGDFEVTAEGAAIPGGEYVMALERWETKLMFGQCAKLALWFIVLAGPHKGARVARYYNVEHLIPPMGEGGKFKARPGSDFLREFSLVSSGTSLAAIRGLPVRGIVRTVDKTKDGAQLNAAAHYSVVAKLVGPYK